VEPGGGFVLPGSGRLLETTMSRTPHLSASSRGATGADLPDREQAVMDVTAEYGVPVVFPESAYAFGTAAQDLDDGPDDGPDGGTAERAVTGEVEPASPLGEIRARLLAARAAHPARTLSVVAADLIGPTAVGAR